MGGFAEYTGSLVLAYPLADDVTVAAAPRDDREIHLTLLKGSGNGSPRSMAWSLDDFLTSEGHAVSAQAILAVLPDGCGGIARQVATAIYALLNASGAERSCGISIAISSTLEECHGIAARSAVCVASMMAISNLWGLDIDSGKLAEHCCQAENLLWRRGQEVSDATAVSRCQAGRIFQFDSRNRGLPGSLELPEGVAFTGIDSGSIHKDAEQKYLKARTTAFMGRNIIGRILAADPRHGPPWDGYLSQLSVTDYVARLRDRLPTKMRGADFLDRFGESGDVLTTIEPTEIYKIRSRTEHHIYENTRAADFAGRIARATRTKDGNAVIEAGELMFASHWSYGQRCGLGSIETDRLVTLLRNEGINAGIYGARISGRGAGGTVVVMHADNETTRQVLLSVKEQYSQATGRRARLLSGTADGATIRGVTTTA